jgi:hypothetical protein
MEKQEASKVISIMMSADGGCRACTHILIESFINDFPKFKDLAIQAWEDCFQEKFEDFD